jgi:hypothetical protein
MPIRGAFVIDRWDLATRLQETSSDLFVLQPGRPVELTGPPGFGLTRLGYRMLADPSRRAPVVVVDVRGWASPMAAWETGVDPERLVIVRCPDAQVWVKVLAALCEGVKAIYAEVPTGVKDQDLRRLGALVRARQVGLGLRPLGGGLPSGVAHLRLRPLEVHWSGNDRGHGRLGSRTLVLEASGRGVAGITRRIEVEDDGANVVRVVPGLVVGESEHAVG